MLRLVSWFLVLAAIGCTLAGVWAAVAPSTAPPPLALETSRDLGPVSFGDHAVTFPIANPAGVPRRVVGLVQQCGGVWCVKSRHHEQVVIGPGETFPYTCTLQVRGAGPFEAPLTLYLDDDGLREVTLTVRGIGVEPEPAPAAPEPAHDAPPPGP
jgi:hypothetical protein